MFKVNCPSCDQVLKSAKEIVPGARLKCPGCGTTFEAPGMDVRAGSPRSGARPKTAPAGSPFEFGGDDDADDFEPRKKSKKPAFEPVDEEDDFDEPRRGRKARFEPVVDDDDDSSSRRGRGSRYARKGSSKKWLVIGAVAGVLVIALVVVLMFTTGGGGGSLGGEQRALIPSDAKVVAGFNVRQFRNGRDYKAIKKEWAGRIPNDPFREMEADVPEAPELFNSLDSLVFAISDFGGAAPAPRPGPRGPKRGPQAPAPGKTVIIMTFSKDPTALLKKATKSVETKTKAGLTVYVAKDGLSYVCQGNVVAMMPMDEDVEGVAKYVADKSRKLPAELGGEIDRVASNGFWFVGQVPPGMLGGPGAMQMMGPEAAMILGSAVGVIDKVRAGSFALDDVSMSRPVNVTATAVLDTSANAEKMRSGVETTWKAFSAMFAMAGNMPKGFPGGGPGGGMPPGLNGLLDDAQKSLKFTSSGNRASASIRLSQKTVQELINSAKDLR